eukprot:TRINITY_DN604_c1_g3_i2.p1 TRINITY_DN604_c1_g3~~TRINITY_DN604_c1_g3_i2.p1  ORF type:complete len:859 (+),score=135.37 TRINITY_DN604_c1_g3_i2:323-2578(+)
MITNITNTLVWTGSEDGTVEVFDVTVGASLAHGQHHPRSIITFTEDTETGFMFSACSGGIGKWGGDITEYYFQKFVPVDVPLSAITAATNKTLFFGDISGKITYLDSESFTAIGQWEAHSSCTVTAICYTGDYLISGGSDGLINVWQGNLSDGPILLHTHDGIHPTKGAIVSLHFESVSGQVWSRDDNSVIRWCADEGIDPPFKVVSDTNNIIKSESTISDMSSFSSWEATRLWSYASNGQTMSWFSSYDVASDEMRRAVDQINNLLEIDNKNLGTWQRQIDKVKNIDHKRKLCMTECMKRTTDNGVLQIYYQKWSRWLRRKQATNKHQTIAAVTSRLTLNGWLREYFTALLQHRKLSKRRKEKERLATFILAGTQMGLKRIYWTKISQYRQQQKAKQKREQLVYMLSANSNSAILNRAFRKLQLYKQFKKNQKKRLQVAQNLLRATDKGILRLYYFYWSRFHSRCRTIKFMNAHAHALLSTFTRGLRLLYHRKCIQWLQLQKQKKLRTVRADCLVRCSDKGLMLTYYTRLRLSINADRKTRMKDKIKRALDKQTLLENDEVLKRYPIMQKMETDQSAKLESLIKKKEEVRDRIKALKERHLALSEKIAQKKLVEKTIQEQFSDIMAKLKELSLNFEQDRNLIIKVTEKCKSTEPYKVFLEAHMEIKAVIVKQSGVSSLGKDDLWPMERVLSKLQSHEYRQLYVGVKIMVITFDIITMSDLDRLETDDEIVLNGENLITLFKAADANRGRR